MSEAAGIGNGNGFISNKLKETIQGIADSGHLDPLSGYIVIP